VRGYVASPHVSTKTTGPKTHLCAHHRPSEPGCTGKPGCFAGGRRRPSDFMLRSQTATGRASPAAMLRLANKLAQIQTSGLLNVDLAWLNYNYQHQNRARFSLRSALTEYAAIEIVQIECDMSIMDW